MPLVHNFGIIKDFDAKKGYSNIDEFGKYPEVFPNALQAYDCVDIHDNYLNDWWERLELMKTFFHRMDRPAFALARYEVTLIPPESLPVFQDIVITDKRIYSDDNLVDLANLIQEAIEKNTYMIHFGV
jgi:hypothetical protein